MTADKIARTIAARAWTIVHEALPAWTNRHYREHPNSAISERQKMELACHACVEEALRTLSAERDEAIRQRDQAREALKPFADGAEKYDPPEGDGDTPAWQSLFFVGQLRRARAALQGGEHGSS